MTVAFDETTDSKRSKRSLADFTIRSLIDNNIGPSCINLTEMHQHLDAVNIVQHFKDSMKVIYPNGEGLYTSSIQPILL